MEISRVKSVCDAVLKALDDQDLTLLQEFGQFEPEIISNCRHHHEFNTHVVRAVCEKELEVLQFLYDNGLPLPLPPTPLCELSSPYDISTLAFLLRSGTPGFDGELTSQPQSGKFSVEYLLGKAFEAWRSGAEDVNSQDSSGWTPLMFAVHYSLSNVVDELLTDLNADVSLSDITGNQAIHLATSVGSVQLCRILLENSADINAVGFSSLTPIHLAAIHCSSSLVELFLSYNANPRLLDCNGLSPLHYSVKSGSSLICEKLVLHGVDVNCRTSLGQTPLFLAAEIGHLGVCQLLIGAGAAIALSFFGSQPLHAAAKNGHHEVVSLLLTANAEADCRNITNITPLHLAASSGDLDSCLFLMNAGASLEATTAEGLRPVHVATFSGHQEILELLLEKGADFNCQTFDAPVLGSSFYHELIDQLAIYSPEYYGCSPIHIACRRGHHSIVQMLLDRGVDINAEDSTGRTPLYHAALQGDIVLCQLLIQAGADIHYHSVDGYQGLHAAVKSGLVAICQLFLDSGSDVDCSTSDGKTPLFFAAERGFTDICKLLLSSKATRDRRDVNGSQPLHVAAQNGNLDILELLCRNRTDCQCVVDGQGMTVTHLALINGHFNVYERYPDHRNLGYYGLAPLLFESGITKYSEFHRSYFQLLADEITDCSFFRQILFFAINSGLANLCSCVLNACSTQVDQTQFLNIACAKGIPETVKMLLIHGCEIDTQTQDGLSPLDCAAKNGHLDVCQLLILNGADVATTSPRGLQPIHHAAKFGHTEVCQYLIDCGADFESFASFCDGPPLHMAVQQGHLEVCRLLIGLGSDFSLPYADGSLPIHEAAFNGYTEIIEMLFANNVSVNTVGPGNMTPLHCAAFGGHLQTCQMIVHAGGDVLASTSTGDQALHYAAQNGDLETCLFLLENGAPVNSLTKTSLTPLHFAANAGNSSACELLTCFGASLNPGVERYPSVSSTELTDYYQSSMVNPLEIAFDQCGLPVCRLLLSKLSDEYHNTDTLLRKAVIRNRLDLVEFLISKGVQLTKSLVEFSCSKNVSHFIHFFLSQCLEAAQQMSKPVDFDIQKHLGSGVPSRFLLEQAKFASRFDLILQMESLQQNDFEPFSGHNDFVEYFGIAQAHFPGCNKDSSLQLFEESITGAIDSKCIGQLEHLPKFHPELITYFNNHVIMKFITEFINQKRFKFFTALERKGFRFPFPAEIMNHQFSHPSKSTLAFLIRTEFVGEAILMEQCCDDYDTLVIQRFQNAQEAWATGAADINRSDSKGWTPLMFASLIGDTEMVKFLIDHGAGELFRNKEGKQAFHVAIESEQYSVCEMFLNLDLNVSSFSVEDLTALHFACKYSNLLICKLLVNSGIDFAAVTNEGYQPLHFAAQSGNPDICEYLIELGTDVDCRSNELETPLFLAAQENALETCNTLFRLEASPNLQTQTGRSPIHAAAQNGSMGICSALIAADAEVNILDSDGKSALLIATEIGSLEIVQLLLCEGAFITKEVREAASDNREIREIITACLQFAFFLFCDSSMDYQRWFKIVPLRFKFRYALYSSFPKYIHEFGEAHDEVAIQGIVDSFSGGRAIYERALRSFQGTDERCILFLDVEKRFLQALKRLDPSYVYQLPQLQQNMIFAIRHHHDIAKAVCQVIVQKDETTLSALTEKGMLLPFPPAFLCQKHSQASLNVIQFLVRTGFPGKPVLVTEDTVCPDLVIQKRLQNACDMWETLSLHFISHLRDKVYGGCDDQGWTPLHFACFYNLYDVVVFLVKRGAKPQFKCDSKLTSLHIAAKVGSLQICQYLIDHILTLSRSKTNSFRLHEAAANGHLGVCRLLTERSSKIDIYHNGYLPIHCAAENGHADICRYLIEQGMFVDSLTESEQTAFFLAAQNGHLDTCKLLVELDALISVCDLNGQKPISVAAQNGHVEVVSYLANLDEGNSFSQALFAAIEDGSEETILVLLQAGADLNTKDANGHTPLLFAVQHESTSLIEFFVSLGATITEQVMEEAQSKGLIRRFLDQCRKTTDLLRSQPDFDIKSTLQDGIPAGYLFLQGLLANRASVVLELDKVVDETDRTLLLRLFSDLESTYNEMLTRLHQGWTPLMFECAETRVESVQYYIERGDDISIRNHFGQNAMHIAAQYSSVEICQLLRPHLVDIDDTTSQGKTSLYLALKHDQFDVCQYLLGQGANPFIDGESRLECSPIFKAVELGYIKQCEDFYRHYRRGWQFWKSPKPLSTQATNQLLEVAVSRNHLEISQFLLSRGASINFPNSKGQTALFFAETRSMVKFLVEAGADPSITDHQGYQPRHFAAIRNNFRAFTSLLPHSYHSLICETDEQGFLQFAVSKHDIEMVRFFASIGIPITDEVLCNARHPDIPTEILSLLVKCVEIEEKIGSGDEIDAQLSLNESIPGGFLFLHGLKAHNVSLVLFINEQLDPFLREHICSSIPDGKGVFDDILREHSVLISETIARRPISEKDFINKESISEFHELGIGGFATVYSATQKCDGDSCDQKRVAIKVPHSSQVEKTITREYNCLKHLNQCHLSDVIVVPYGLVYLPHRLTGQPLRCLVMELCESSFLDFLKDPKNTSSNHDLLRFCLQAARAVMLIHNEKIYHADLCLRNFLITSSKSLKLADFGVSRTVHTVEQTYSKRIGNGLYSAPELFYRAFTPSYSADIYSLGVCFIAMFNNGSIPGNLETEHVLAGTRIPCDSIPFPELRPAVQSMVDHDPSLRTQLGDIIAIIENILQ